MIASRFQNLEFQTETPAGAAPEPVATDAAQCVDWMKEAGRSRRRGRFEQALRDYGRAVGDRPALRGGWLGQARMLIALEEYAEADLWTAKALELFRDDGDLTAAQAQARARLGETAQAQAAADAAIRLPGESAYRWLVRGELLLIARNPLAARCLGKILQLRDDWLTRIEIAEVCLFQRQPATALDHVQRAVHADAGEPYGWRLLAECQRGLGLKCAAQRSVTTWLELDPADPQARAAMESLTRDRWQRRLWNLFS